MPSTYLFQESGEMIHGRFWHLGSLPFLAIGHLSSSLESCFLLWVFLGLFKWSNGNRRYFGQSDHFILYVISCHSSVQNPLSLSLSKSHALTMTLHTLHNLGLFLSFPSLFPSLPFLLFFPLLFTPLHLQWPPCVLRAPTSDWFLDGDQVSIFLKSYVCPGEKHISRVACEMHGLRLSS